MRADGSVEEKGSHWGDWAFTLLGGWLLKPVWVRVNFALRLGGTLGVGSRLTLSALVLVMWLFFSMSETIGITCRG